MVTTDNTAEYERMWFELSPQLKSELMADPDRALSANDVVKLSGSGSVLVVSGDAYWTATQSGGAFRLTRPFREFVLGKREAD